MTPAYVALSSQAMGQQQDGAECSSQAGTTAHKQQGQGRQGWEWCPWIVVSGLSIIQGKKCRKGVRKDVRKWTWLRKKEHSPLGLQFTFEGSWAVTQTTEPCYIMAWWHGTVPHKDPKRLAASRNEGADPRGIGAA